MKAKFPARVNLQAYLRSLNFSENLLWATYHVKHFSSVTQSVQLFETAWTAACQASLSITNSQSLFKLISIELVMPSNHLILCRSLSSCLQSFPVSGSFQMSQFFASGGQSIGVWASASVLPVNIQDWFPSGWTGWISLQSLAYVYSFISVLAPSFGEL